MKQTAQSTSANSSKAPLSGTRFGKSIKPPKEGMIKSGKQNAKLGGTVTVKMWQGMPIYSLTLEERATCPKTCDQWDNCYGNNMPFAHRYDHTHADFYRFLAEDLDRLARKHPQGFVMRLHVLGDFFDAEYVAFWVNCLRRIPQLRIYGYTHHKSTSALGQLIRGVNNEFPDRFRVRISDNWRLTFSANVVPVDVRPENLNKSQLLCPEQTGKTESCATCGLCWSQPKRQILFMEH